MHWHFIMWSLCVICVYDSDLILPILFFLIVCALCTSSLPPPNSQEEGELSMPCLEEENLLTFSLFPPLCTPAYILDHKEGGKKRKRRRQKEKGKGDSAHSGSLLVSVKKKSSFSTCHLMYVSCTGSRSGVFSSQFSCGGKTNSWQLMSS